MPVAVAPNEVRSLCAIERTGVHRAETRDAYLGCSHFYADQWPQAATNLGQVPRLEADRGNARKASTDSAPYGTSRAAVPLYVPQVS